MWLTLTLIGIFFWALVNVLDSLLVHHYHSHPVVLSWNQSYLTLSMLLGIALLFDVQSTWIIPLTLAGMCAYAGDIVFFRTLKVLDVSVTNLAWAILSIFLALAGIFFFHDVWSWSQSMGAGFVLVAIISLSFWGKSLGLSSFLLLLVMALLYTPFYFEQKVALERGDTVLAVFFWSLLGRECVAFLFPWFVPSFRKEIVAYLPRITVPFVLLGIAVVLCFFVGTYAIARAYTVGSLSFVAIVSNLQPFLVLFLAWLMHTLWPRRAPKELLTKQSLGIKILSFSLAFFGLALIALP